MTAVGISSDTSVNGTGPHIGWPTRTAAPHAGQSGIRMSRSEVRQFGRQGAEVRSRESSDGAEVMRLEAQRVQGNLRARAEAKFDY